MIVGIHQPHFLPWLGYFNKALHCDVFVWLHAVQYRKNYFQNRTLIKNVNEQPLWLTLPVHAKLGIPIDTVTIAEARWREKIQKSVEQCYRKAPFFAACWPPLLAALQQASDNLDAVNFQTFLALVGLLDGQNLRVERAGKLAVTALEPTQRLVEICRVLGATRYVAGKGGHNYLRVEEFDKAGIEVVWQAFDPATVVYRQLGKTFVPGLSVIDCLFNMGPVETKRLALAAWKP